MLSGLHCIKHVSISQWLPYSVVFTDLRFSVWFIPRHMLQTSAGTVFHAVLTDTVSSLFLVWHSPCSLIAFTLRKAVLSMVSFSSLSLILLHRKWHMHFVNLHMWMHSLKHAHSVVLGLVSQFLHQLGPMCPLTFLPTTFFMVVLVFEFKDNFVKLFSKVSHISSA